MRLEPCRMSRAPRHLTVPKPRRSRRVECAKKILQAFLPPFLPPLASVALPIGRLDVQLIVEGIDADARAIAPASHRAGRLPPERRSRKTGQTIDHFRSTINLNIQDRECNELSRVRRVFEGNRAGFFVSPLSA